MSEFTKPIKVKLEDGTWWTLLEPTEYYIDENAIVIISVPAGFKTNFATIPKILRPFFSDHAIYNHAAVVHDYLYSFKSIYSRKEIDELFYDGMLVLKINKFTAKLFYLAVRLFGWKYYNPK